VAASEEMTPVTRVRHGIVGRMLHGTGAGAVATVLGIASNLLLLPLYLHHWTVAVYGEWMALYSVVSYLGTLDFGLTTAGVNAATIAYARKDWQVFKRIQGTTWAASIVLAALGGLIVAALFFFFNVNRLLGLKAISQHDTRLVFGGLSVALLASIPGRQLSSLYVALGEFAKYQWLYNIGVVVVCIATASALTFGAGPVSLAAVNAGTSLFVIAATYGLIWWRSHLLIPRLRDAEWATARSLAAPTGQFGLQVVASALLVQGPIVILSRALGGPAVAIFTTTRTVANVVKGVLTVFRAPLRPEYVAAFAQPTKDKLRGLFRTVMAIDSVIAITLMAGLWSGGVWLIRFWSHGHIAPDAALLHWLLMHSLLEGFLGMLAAAGSAANRFHGVSLGILVYAVFSLLLAAMLIGRFGASAIPLAAIASMIPFYLPASLKNASREIGLTRQSLTIRLLLPFAATAILVAGLSEAIAYLGITPEWLAACFAALSGCVVSVILTGILFLTRNDRQLLIARLNTL